MNTQLFRSFFFAVTSVLLLAVAACTPSYINTENFGTAATAEQIDAHFAGNSIKFANEPGRKPNIEAYFDADGTYKLVALDDTVFSVGTWKAHSGLGQVKMVIQAKQYILENGRKFSEIRNEGFVVYIQPDGTTIGDQMGGGNFTQPKPTRGFQAERRWNSLMRQAGL